MNGLLNDGWAGTYYTSEWPKIKDRGGKGKEAEVQHGVTQSRQQARAERENLSSKSMEDRSRWRPPLARNPGSTVRCGHRVRLTGTDHPQQKRSLVLTLRPFSFRESSVLREWLESQLPRRPPRVLRVQSFALSGEKFYHHSMAVFQGEGGFLKSQCVIWNMRLLHPSEHVKALKKGTQNCVCKRPSIVSS